MSEHLVLDLLLTIASNALDDSFLNQWNCLMLETFYLLFRPLKPSSLAENQATQPRRDLARLLETEVRSKLEERRKWTSSRHSRFGTTITMKSKVNNEDKVILHKQAAVGKSAVEALDRGKKTLTKRTKMSDALGSTAILTVEAKTVLQGVARDFIISCFNRTCLLSIGRKRLTSI
jgi:replication fork protection complex subunit Tof1/Swi1